MFASDGRIWGGFKLLPGMSRHEDDHRIGNIEDSVQLSRQVPQNSGRRSERIAMTEGRDSHWNSGFLVTTRREKTLPHSTAGTLACRNVVGSMWAVN